MKSKLLLFLLISAYLSSVLIVHFYFKAKQQEENVAGASIVQTADKKPAKGIILPHHDVAGDLINESFSRLSREGKYSTVVIFAPNHFHPEKVPAATADQLTDSPIAADFVYELTADLPLFVNDPAMLESEHGVTIFLPFIKEYFKEAQIVPIIFSPKISPSELERLASFLVRHTTPETLYILSLDFSHNSNAREGIKKNEETLKVMKRFDYDTLYTFGDENLDSPKAAAAFLMVMERLKAVNFDLWHNTHSAVLLADLRLSGTSYAIGVLRQ